MTTPNLPRQRFSDASLQAISKTVRTVLGTPTTSPESQIETPDLIRGERFRLREPLTPGYEAIARRMDRMELEGAPEGEYEWIESDDDTPVFGFGSQQNFLAAGAEVTCIETPYGWCVVDGGAAMVLPPKEELEAAGIKKIEPFMVFPAVTFSNEFKYAWRAECLEPVEFLFSQLVETDRFFALAGKPSASPVQRSRLETDADAFILSPVVRLGTVAPVRCAYKPFDSLMANGQPFPPLIMNHVKVNEAPQGKELWGPSISGKITRSFYALELFWWEIRTVYKYTVRDILTHVWQPEHPDHLAYLGHPPDPTNPDLTWPPVILSYWWFTTVCGDAFSGGLASTPIRPPASRFFIAPYGWWETPEWERYGYDWFRTHYQYSPSTGSYSPISGDGFFGPWINWTHWATYSGSLGPSTTQPPQPPCGDIFQRSRYGFVVWEYGWEIIPNSVDEDAETCVVAGPLHLNFDLVYDDTTLPTPTPTPFP